MAALDWPELYFIRHGETDWNAEGRYQGAQATFRSTIRGRGQADLNGELLQRAARARRPSTPADFDWYVSPLGRTRETMDRVRAAFAEPLPEVTVDPRLIEISFGIYEGQLHTELAAGEMAIAGERDAELLVFPAARGRELRRRRRSASSISAPR